MNWTRASRRLALRAALLVGVVIGASAIGVVVAGGGAPQADDCSAQVINVLTSMALGHIQEVHA